MNLERITKMLETSLQYDKWVAHASKDIKNPFPQVRVSVSVQYHQTGPCYKKY